MYRCFLFQLQKEAKLQQSVQFYCDCDVFLHAGVPYPHSDAAGNVLSHGSKLLWLLCSD